MKTTEQLERIINILTDISKDLDAIRQRLPPSDDEIMDVEFEPNPYVHKGITDMKVYPRALSKDEIEKLHTEPDVDLSILNETDVFYVKTADSKWLTKGDIFNPDGDFKCYNIVSNTWGTPSGDLCKPEEVIELRRASSKGAELFYMKFPDEKPSTQHELVEVVLSQRDIWVLETALDIVSNTYYWDAAYIKEAKGLMDKLKELKP